MFTTPFSPAHEISCIFWNIFQTYALKLIERRKSVNFSFYNSECSDLRSIYVSRVFDSISVDVPR